MICKKCSAEYDDSYAACPECSEKNEAAINGSFTEEDMTVEQGYDENADRQERYKTPEYRPPIKKHYVRAEKKERGEKTVKRRVSKQEPAKTENKKTEKMSKTEKKATLLLSLILCLVGVSVFTLTYIRVKTDAFEQQTQQQKTVALSKLSAEEEALLEKELSAYYSVTAMSDFHQNNCSAEDFLACVNPADTGNVYALVLGETAPLQTVEDPAMRFADENGTYAYYKVEGAKIDKLLSRFGLSSYGNINSKDYYFYDGFYYFRAVEAKSTPVASADIVKSKKVSDGSFYAEFYFYLTNGASNVKSDNFYACVEKNEDTSKGCSFVVSKMDSEPIFDDSGKPAATQSAFQYKTEKKVIEGKTTDGKLYCRYIVEYPVFSGKTAGEKSINTFFEGAVSAYELRASGAQQDYESFISKGGNVAELPFTETTVATIAYSDNEKISVVEKIAAYSPEVPEAEQTTTASDEGYSENRFEGGFNQNQSPEKEPVKLFDRTVEAYVFDVVTGDFVEKDDIIGKDYMLISDILYRIYNSYDYESLLPVATTTATTDINGNVISNEEITQPTTEERYDDYYGDYYGYDDDEENRSEDGVSADEDGFGTIIYESACCYTENGFTFFYVESEGYITEVTLPQSAVERLAE